MELKNKYQFIKSVKETKNNNKKKQVSNLTRKKYLTEDEILGKNLKN
jgi:hypothetical protein